MNDEKERTELPKLDPNWWNEAPAPSAPEEEPPAPGEPESAPASPPEPVPQSASDPESASDLESESDPEEPFVEVLTSARHTEDWEDVDDAEVWSQLPPIGSSHRQTQDRTAPAAPSGGRRKPAPRRKKRPVKKNPPAKRVRTVQKKEVSPEHTQKFDKLDSKPKKPTLLQRLQALDRRLALAILIILLGLLLICGWMMLRQHRARTTDNPFNDSDLWSQQDEKETQSLPRYDGDSSDVTLTLVSAQSEEGEETREPLTYQQLYKKCAPSVVSITVKNNSGRGSGSGVVLTKDGYIITCAHVIRNQAQATVTVSDGKSYDATLVGSDPQTDLALLKIEAKKLTPAEFGRSKDLTVGDEALAIGDPLGPTFRATLTNGIISAINRDVTLNGYAMTLIQTTAALNSGNSGGPLLNIYGQVVGINNMKMVSSNTTVEGLGFAVPSTTAKEVIETLALDGGISRPVLGVTCYGVSEEVAEENGTRAGLVVVQVNGKSDCAKEGIRPGDLIAEIDGKAYTDVTKFKKAYKDAKVGQKVTLTLYRPRRDADAQWSAQHPNEPPERPVEYQSIGQVTVALIDQQDLS